MDWLYYILVLIICLCGLFLTILNLPGLWLIVASVGTYAWITASRGYVSKWSLIAIVLLALAAEIMEFVAGSAGAAKAGASKRAMLGAVVGGLIGGFFFTFIPIPIIGTIVGVCLGAFAGAAIVELLLFKDIVRSLRVGAGAAKGRFYGIILKLAFGLAMLLLTIVSGFPVGGYPRTATITTTTTPTTVSKSPSATLPAPP